MVQATCIQKFRDKHNQIYGYRIKDTDGKTIDVKPESLKHAIKTNQIKILNLTLTSDNRLIDSYTSVNKQPVQKKNTRYADTEITSMLNRAKLLGLKIEKVKTICGNPCYLISKSNINHIILIPDNVRELNDPKGLYGVNTFTEALQNLNGHIRVIGGNGLIQGVSMFCEFVADSIDLSSLNTSNMKNMDGMFEYCAIPSLDLSSFDTSNVTNISRMFDNCKSESINLSSFNTEKVMTMDFTFNGCKVKLLDLSSFNTDNVNSMCSMFQQCKATSIDLSSFNTSNVKNMSYMFYMSMVRSLNLSSFNTCNVEDMSCMFWHSNAESLDLTSFDTSNVRKMEYMFCECLAKSIDLSSFDTSNVRDDYLHKMFERCDAIVQTNDERLKSVLRNSK